MSEKFVYFIKPVGMDGPIKIGCSRLPAERLKGLMVWSPLPLEIVAQVPGGFDLEQNIHHCFADLYTHSEWFKPSPRLLAVIERLRSGAPIHEAMDLSARLPRKSHKELAWERDPEGRERCSYVHRLNHAAKRRTGRMSGVPADLTQIMRRWQGRYGQPTRPTAAEFRRLDAFIAREPAEVAA